MATIVIPEVGSTVVVCTGNGGRAEGTFVSADSEHVVLEVPTASGLPKTRLAHIERARVTSLLVAAVRF